MAEVGICERCGKRRKLDPHHKDGNHNNDAKGNVAKLCRTCHLKVHTFSKGQNHK
ncbi:hypothetical protein LCGC14_1744480 [marine sediment metagenome]|uniref:HNH domain-containing protein n=1 Tax=marine sediment metagenome TaxID=412755 RepID=A0A0F9HTC7_9ZZZZ